MRHTRGHASLDEAVLELDDRPDARAELDVDGGHEAEPVVVGDGQLLPLPRPGQRYQLRSGTVSKVL